MSEEMRGSRLQQDIMRGSRLQQEILRNEKALAKEHLERLQRLFPEPENDSLPQPKDTTMEIKDALYGLSVATARAHLHRALERAVVSAKARLSGKGIEVKRGSEASIVIHEIVTAYRRQLDALPW